MKLAPIASLALVACLSATSCSSLLPVGPVPDVTVTTTQTADPAAEVQANEKEAAAAYEAYFSKCMTKARKNPEKAFELMLPCTTRRRALDLETFFEERAEINQQINGSNSISAILGAATITPTRVLVDACLDQRGIVLNDTITGEELPNFEFTHARMNAYVEKQPDGQWILVHDAIEQKLNQPCPTGEYL